MNKTLLLAVALAVAAPASAKTYTIDAAHSAVGFTVRHLVTKVHGGFAKFSGTIDYEPGKPKAWRADVEIDPASIDTRVAARDAHLRNPDFFDVEKCPKMAFKSTKAEASGETGGKLYGDLTMHCVTKPVVLDLEIAGEATDPKGNPVFGASATGKLSRKDWGITSGAGMVGDEVTLQLDVEARPAGDKKAEKQQTNAEKQPQPK
jgi:polyisoprenoid-binding protein YceI